MLVSGAALLLAGAAFAAYDVLTYRDTLVQSLSVQAQIIAANSISAVIFDDPTTANETLAALAASPEIVAADIRTADGRSFASFRRGGEERELVPPPFADGELEAQRFTAGTVALARRIMLSGQPTSMVVIESEMTALYLRLRRYLALTGAVICAAMLLALVVSRIGQRSIAQPLTQVADVARRISEGNDYSLRASIGRESTSELATLASAFNHMLSGIESRDQSLMRAHDELEDRVRERTAELDATNGELEAFSYSVSHDLRAPLRHVTGFASLLERHLGAALDEQGKRYVKTINESAARMGVLIDDLLAFSRMGRAPLNKRRVDLLQLVNEAKAEVTDRTNGGALTWTIGDLPWVDADPALLKPALVNLLSNAVKYSSTREHPSIDVGSIASPGDEVVLFVRDNGVGFDMAYADKLFGVFQRLHRAEDFPGTGIGLANVRRIVQRHGGRAWAESTVDVGATFYISLPSTAPFA